MPKLAEIEPETLVELVQPFDGAVEVDRVVMAARAQFGDDPLRLAERVSADQHAAADGSECSRWSSRSISLPVSGWRKTGRPNVASVMKMSQGTGTKPGQVGSGAALVVARHDDLLALVLKHDLRAAEHMAGGDVADIDLADADAFRHKRSAWPDLRPVANFHDRQRLGRRQHCAMAAARMIAVAVGDQRLGLGLRWVDPRVGGPHVDALRVRLDPGTQARHCELYRQKRRKFPEREETWTKSLVGIMEIVGPAILLIVLIWLVMRRRSTGKTGRTEQATRDLYAEEEQRRRDGTDQL